MTDWDVELAISGAILLRERTLTFQTMKGENRPFMTHVKLTNAEHGVRVNVIVRASEEAEANDAGVYFVGRMLDILALRVDLPLYLSLYGPRFRISDNHVKRIIDDHEWQSAFQDSWQYKDTKPTLRRALSWYRKGLNTEDPTDKFLAFWNALEVIGSRCARSNERTERGIINKICDCFDQLWRNSDNWHVIPNEPHKINEFYAMRNSISHGTLRIVDAGAIQEVTQMLPTLRQLAYRFLCAWELDGQCS